MRGNAAGVCIWLGLSLACGVVPGEVLDVYEGQASTSTSTTSDKPGSTGADSTGPAADGSGSAADDDGSNGDSTADAVDPGTSEGDTSAASTGPASSSDGDDPTTTGASPTCNEIYGAANGYILCMETDTECRFSAIIVGTNCTNICSLFGGTCYGAFNNPEVVGMSCVENFPEDCNVTHNDEICVCSK